MSRGRTEASPAVAGVVVMEAEEVLVAEAAVAYRPLSG